MLDEDLARIRGFQGLQRTAISAPLVGVLITAAGLLLLDPPGSDSLTMGSILQAIKPLFIGVIVGAVLALINQVMLLWVQFELDRTRAEARNWFDRKVWSDAVQGPRRAVDATVAALGLLGETIRKVSKDYEDDWIRVRNAARDMHGVSRETASIVADFGGRIAGLTPQMDAMRDATVAARKAAETLGPAFGESRKILDGAAKGFGSAADDFIDAARDHKAAAGEVVMATSQTRKILARVGASTRLLKQHNQDLAKASSEMTTLGNGLRTSLKDDLLPAQGDLAKIAQSLKDAAAKVPSVIEQASLVFSTLATGLNTNVDAIGNASTELGKIVKEGIKPAADLHRKMLTQAAGVGEGLDELLSKVKASSESLAQSYLALARSADLQSEVSKKIDETLGKEFIPRQDKLAGAVDKLAGSSETLKRFVEDGVVPATDRLAELGKIVETVREAAESIRSLGNLKDDIGRVEELLRSIRKTLDASAAIKGMGVVVQQLTDTLEHATTLGQTVSNWPEDFGKHLDLISRQAIQLQGRELREMLSDVMIQLLRHVSDPELNGAMPVESP